MANHTDMNKIISKIRLPGMQDVYEIHDASAIHSISDLGLDEAMKFRGVVETPQNLPASGNTPGDVYHVVSDDQEYIWVEIDGQGHWEEFGSKFFVEHVHGASLAVSGTATGAATVTGENGTSEVTGTGAGTVSVPKVTKAANYIKGSVDVVTGVEGNGTANAITGFGEHSTADAITGLATGSVNSATASDVTIPNVTGNEAVTASKVSASEGSAASWSANVTDGILEFSWTANVPTTVTATDVAATKVTLGTAIAASKVTTAPVSVVTGANGTAKAITALGAITTAAALTGVKATTETKAVALAEATAADGILVGDTVAVTSEDKTVNVNVTGTAAAQTWTQTSGTIEGTISGTATGKTSGAVEAE